MGKGCMTILHETSYCVPMKASPSGRLDTPPTWCHVELWLHLPVCSELMPLDGDGYPV